MEKLASTSSVAPPRRACPSRTHSRATRVIVFAEKKNQFPKQDVSLTFAITGTGLAPYQFGA